ncbi:MAG: hypothetical protein U5R31_00565 [Acidimicrobiia bacterium]|nr:hypothetical protein [Acidimicrobiia bacterium]
MSPSNRYENVNPTRVVVEKADAEMPTQPSEYERFESLATALVQVPKNEVDVQT